MTISVIGKKKQVKKSFEELLADLQTSSSEKVRYNAARVLGEMGDSKAVEPLINVLKNDKNGSVRLYAARALGEFGATLMIAGNIPGKTQTMPLAIFFKVQSMDYKGAMLWVWTIVLISVAMILILNKWSDKQQKIIGKRR